VKARITVVETIAHVGMDLGFTSPTGVEARWWRPVASAEQVYQRRLMAGPSWQPLDSGWIEQVGMVVVENVEGHGLQVIPTPEEKAAIAARVVELGLMGDEGDCRDFACVLPGEHLRLQPTQPVHLRCRAGEARVVVTVYPR